MVHVLMDGAEHTAGELSRAAGVSPGTGSEHLSVLVESAIVTVTRDGRFRRYRIAGPRLARALETLSRPGDRPVTSLRLSREQQRVRQARTCYDHLAGQLGVGFAEAMVRHGWVSERLDQVTDAGEQSLSELGVPVGSLRRIRRTLIRPCLDWTEHRAHVAGSVGASLANLALQRGWVQRVPDSRGLRITAGGLAACAALEITM